MAVDCDRLRVDRSFKSIHTNTRVCVCVCESIWIGMSKVHSGTNRWMDIIKFNRLEMLYILEIDEWECKTKTTDGQTENASKKNSWIRCAVRKKWGYCTHIYGCLPPLRVNTISSAIDCLVSSQKRRKKNTNSNNVWNERNYGANAHVWRVTVT